MDFSKCICESPGFCPIYGRLMEEDPPNWKWCQQTNNDERKQYYDLLSKSPPSKNTEITQFFKNFPFDKKWFYLAFLNEYDRYNTCDLSSHYQALKNQDIIKYAIDQNANSLDLSNIQILCLGHHDKQFATIDDRPYLTKIYLNQINAGRYSDNKWAESRAFLDDSLFREDVDFIGFVTASWNLKYESFCHIDNFHNWNNAKILLNSQPSDNIILCADMLCPCTWFHSKHNVLSLLFKQESVNIVGQKLLDLFELDFNFHIKTPASNQMILHKNVFNIYKKDLLEKQIFEKIDDFMSSFAIKFLREDLSDYVYKKLNSYFIEMFTFFWFANKNFRYLANAQRRISWYNNGITSSVLEAG